MFEELMVTSVLSKFDFIFFSDGITEAKLTAVVFVMKRRTQTISASNVEMKMSLLRSISAGFSQSRSQNHILYSLVGHRYVVAICTMFFKHV